VVNEVIAEAYLALEAYAHALFSKSISIASEDENHEDHEYVTKELDDARKSRLAMIQFAKEQLRVLVPAALDAATLFAGVIDSAISRLETHLEKSAACARAAAGHFVATVLAMTSGAQVFIAAEVINRISSCAQLAANDAVRYSSEYNASLGLFLDDKEAEEAMATPAAECAMLTCSVVHAAARILPRADSAHDILCPVMQNLISVVDAVSSVDDANPSRLSNTVKAVAVNAATEWLGLSSKYHASAETVKHALILLTQSSDAQVSADLIVRCMLNVRVLRALEPALSEQLATRLVSDLLPRTVTALLASTFDGRYSREDSAKTEITTVPPKRSQNDNGGSEIEAGCYSTLGAPLLSAKQLFSFWIHDELSGDEVATETGSSLVSRDDLDAGACVLDIFRKCGAVSGCDVYAAIIMGASGESLLSESRPTLQRVLLCAGMSVTHSTSLLPGGPETAMVSVSTEKVFPFVDRLLFLCDALVAHGPGGNETRALASIIASTIFRTDADVSLRQALWDRAAVDCGGLALFAHADTLGGRAGYAGPGDDCDSGGGAADMVRLFADALARPSFTRAASAPVLKALWGSVAGRLVQSAANPALASTIGGLAQTESGRALVNEMLITGAAGFALEASQRRAIASVCEF
jgi:hypothetical protein